MGADSLLVDARSIVLVVDDAPDNLALMQGLLKEVYRVKGARNGERALAIARAEPRPDLILLDLMMPDMDGFEVCRQLKADPHTAGIPVIILTGTDDERDEALALELGAADFLTRPVRPRVMHARIRTQLALRRSIAGLHQQVASLKGEIHRATRDLEGVRAEHRELKAAARSCPELVGCPLPTHVQPLFDIGQTIRSLS